MGATTGLTIFSDSWAVTGKNSEAMVGLETPERREGAAVMETAMEVAVKASVEVRAGRMAESRVEYLAAIRVDRTAETRVERPAE